MTNEYGFSKTELLKYQHIPTPVKGEEYLLAMACLKGKDPAQNRTADFALRAKRCRDGMEGFLFSEETLRRKRTDRDLYWRVYDEGDGRVSLWSNSAEKFLNLGPTGATFSRKKQILFLEPDGEFYVISARVKEEIYYLRASGHRESLHGLIFTSGRDKVSVSFAFLKRIRNRSATPQSKTELTVATMTDIHVDYGLQLFAPYLRRSVIAGANAFRRRFDIDALLTCGDNISDNGSGGYRYGGALQGKWPRARFLKTQDRLYRAMQKSFRDPEKKKNVFLITGNHDTQVGDRQPEGKKFNSGDYARFLPETVSVLTSKIDDVDVGSDTHVLCYEARVKNIPFLMLNTPRYPLNPKAHAADRFAPGHTEEQANWVVERLNAIEREQGRNAIVFVSSHYPFWPGCYGPESKDCPDNRKAYVTLYEAFCRFPNLFFFHGHTHGGSHWTDVTHTSENCESRSFLETRQNETGAVVYGDHHDRGCFRSDLIESTGFHHLYAGSLAFYRTEYFANDGKKPNSWLCEIEVPFFQGLAVEVYDDRVVLTMQNLGTRNGVYDHIPGATYQLKPLVYLLKK